MALPLRPSLLSRPWFCLGAALLFIFSLGSGAFATTEDTPPLRVFIFAGQSNMEGADSRVEDIARFPPYVGLDRGQPQVRFAYSIGRNAPAVSKGWTHLQPVKEMVGPELSFARQLTRSTPGPLAIIKCAAGGTHLGGDWNPDQPSGFEMYPRALELVRASLAELEAQDLPYRIEALVWHQGENDMFNETYQAEYGKNLKRFLQCWRRDLNVPDLKVFVGELCTKTIWGMDLRPRMYAISLGQRSVTDEDPHAFYVPTAHIGVEIGNPVGLHYHYGTLGQLQHGENYAAAYLKSLGRAPDRARPLATWPYPEGSEISLVILAGHRNMEGERAFLQELPASEAILGQPAPSMAFRYSVGGGYRKSEDWEPLGPIGYYDTFGPELSMAHAVKAQQPDTHLAIAKFTHSGSQMNDWTPEGTPARSRHLYPEFIDFVKSTLTDLKDKRGHRVRLAGIFYHVGENEMSMPPYRKSAAEWLRSTIRQSRQDLQMPELPWFVSQQPPTDHENVNTIDVVEAMRSMTAEDPHTTHLMISDFPPQEKRLVLDTQGILHLGRRLAAAYLSSR